MSILVLVDLDVRPDRLTEAHALFADLLSQTRARDGNEGATVHVHHECSTSIMLVER